MVHNSQAPRTKHTSMDAVPGARNAQEIVVSHSSMPSLLRSR